MSELDAVDERELVQEDHQRREEHQAEVRPGDPERPLAPVRERPEERDRDEVANRPVRERFPAVLEHVLRNRDVECPEEYRPEQHRVDGRSSAHRRNLPIRLCRMPEPTIAEIDALVGPATPHFAYQLRARVRSEEHTSELQSQSNLVCRLLLEKKNIPRSPPTGGSCSLCTGLAASSYPLV